MSSLADTVKRFKADKENAELEARKKELTEVLTPPTKPQGNSFGETVQYNAAKAEYDRKLAKQNDLKARLTEELKAPDAPVNGSSADWLGYSIKKSEYERKVKDQKALREAYPNWQDVLVKAESPSPSPTPSTTRNNSILTGATGDSTTSNVRRKKLFGSLLTGE